MKKSSLLMLSMSLFALCACDAPLTKNQIVLKNFAAPIEIHQEHQKLYLEDTRYENVGAYAAYASLENYANPAPTYFKFNYKYSIRAGKKTVLRISENEDMSDALEYDGTGKTREIYNLKVNTKYYWNVDVSYADAMITSATEEFTTSNTILRNIYVDGVDNVRDLGGYMTSSGKTVKQGLIYRSGELTKNKDMNSPSLVTPKGIETLNKELKIKTEVDLRKNELVDGISENGGLTYSPIGSDVNYVNLPMYYDGENMLAHSDANKDEINKNSIKSFFNLLKDKNNYPILFHCVQGKDRTGMLAYILNALLGVSPEDLYRDYLFTNFSKSVGSPCKINDIATRYALTISKFDGESLQEKTRNMLKTTFEFSDADLDAIITNLL